MTNDELTAIEARAKAATLGPWTWRSLSGRHKYDVMLAPPAQQDHRDNDTRWDDDKDDLVATGQRIVETDSGAYGPREPDAEFIAHARTDVPALVAEVTRAMAVIREIIYASDDCQGHRDCAHSMSPWIDARELLYEFENEQEALTELRRRRHGDIGRTGPMT